MKIGLILLAGGKSTRMGGESSKVFLEILGVPVIQYSLKAFQTVNIEEIVVVCEEDHRNCFNADCLFASPGIRRQDSVENGLTKLSQRIDAVLVHDGARPLISPCDIEKLIEAGITHPACALGKPISNTIKQTDPLGFVTETLPRDNLWDVYTPQFVTRSLLEEGFSYVNKKGLTVTDELGLVESIGIKPKLIASTSPNIKITYPSDLTLIEAMLSHV